MKERFLAYKKWKRRTLLVLKMNTESISIESSLEHLGISYLVYNYKDDNLLKKWKSDSDNICGIIVTGSSTQIEDGMIEPSIPDTLMNANVPILGICFGHEILGQHLGFKVIECNTPIGETGAVFAKLERSKIFQGIDVSQEQMVNMHHTIMLKDIPSDCEIIASTQLTPIAGFVNKKNNIWGVQFHPERNWLHDIIFDNFYKICLNKL